MTPHLDPALLLDVLAWVPERARVATLGAADAPLWTAILAARPHLNAVSDGPADVVLCVEPADPHRAVEAARRLLHPRGHLLLVSTRSPADVIECADGAHVHTQPTVGASILYLILWPSLTSEHRVPTPPAPTGRDLTPGARRSSQVASNRPAAESQP